MGDQIQALILKHFNEDQLLANARPGGWGVTALEVQKAIGMDFGFPEINNTSKMAEASRGGYWMIELVLTYLTYGMGVLEVHEVPKNCLFRLLTAPKKRKVRPDRIVV